MLAVLCGCATAPPPRSDAAGPAVELAEVPFFPQADFQCGPAALATVLVHSGVPVTPDELAPRVYLPARRGSLQLELTAAARQYDRVPYRLDADLDAIRAEVRAGRPVLVLQNLALAVLPRWHYAVVVGTDDSGALLLRSGTKPRVRTSERRFLATWNRAERWALVALRPGELPTRADPRRLTESAAALEALGRLEAARATYEAIVGRWPRESLAWFGLGNVHYRLAARSEAEAAWRRALEESPDHAPSLNNLAQVMADRGCPREAHALIARARSHADSAGVAAAVADTERSLPPPDSASAGDCDPIAPGSLR